MWLPASGQNTQPGELWPQIEGSCGPAGSDNINPESTMNPTDGSAGEPGVRLAAFVNGFTDSVLASVCDASYASVASAIATKVGQLPSNGSCLTGRIQNNTAGLPNCTAVAQVPNGSGTTKSVSYANCEANAYVVPCWTLVPRCEGQTVAVAEDANAPSSSITVKCQVCQDGATVPGC
jgi:hypothetical protein